jgi:hypothetical protein
MSVIPTTPTPITPESLQEAGFEARCGGWSLDIGGAVEMLVDPMLNGIGIVTLQDEWQEIELPRDYATIEQLTDLIRILKGN